MQAESLERLLAVVEQYVQRDDNQAAAIARADGVPPLQLGEGAVAFRTVDAR